MEKTTIRIGFWHDDDPVEFEGRIHARGCYEYSRFSGYSIEDDLVDQLVRAMPELSPTDIVFACQGKYGDDLIRKLNNLEGVEAVEIPRDEDETTRW